MPDWAVREGRFNVYRAAMGLRAVLDGRTELHLVADGVSLPHELARKLPRGVLAVVCVDGLPTDLSGMQLAYDPRCVQRFEEIRAPIFDLSEILRQRWPAEIPEKSAAFALTGTYQSPRLS